MKGGERERFEFLCIFLLGNLWEVFELFSLAVPSNGVGASVTVLQITMPVIRCALHSC